MISAYNFIGLNFEQFEGLILGYTDFVNWVKRNFLSGRQKEKEIPQLNKLKPKVAPEKVIQAVCLESDCSQENIVTKGRKKNKAREVAIYLTRDMSGLSCKDLGIYSGDVSGALITIMYNRIAEQAKQNSSFKLRIDRIKKQIFNI
ncbi:MAG: hypothetical protein ACMUJM_13690 [bacterium]